MVKRVLQSTTLDTRFTVHFRPASGVLPVPENWTVGLLTHKPTPEGYGYRELDAEGYERVPVAFHAPRKFDRALISAASIKFNLPGVAWTMVRYGGLFEERGQLVSYGVITGLLTCETSGLILPAGSIQVRINGS